MNRRIIKYDRQAGLWQIKPVRLLLAIVVSLFTVYALMSPAITLVSKGRQRAPGSDNFSSSDLADFVDDYVMTDASGTVVEDLSTVYVGEKYKVRIHFTESNIIGNNMQFELNDDGYLTYNFNTDFLNFEPTNWTDLIFYNLDTEQDVVIGRFQIDDDGILTVEYYNVDNEGNEINEAYCDHYPNTDLYIEFEFEVEDDGVGDGMSIDLGNNVHINITPTSDADLSVTKTKTSSNYSDVTHSLSYRTVVKCEHGVITDLALTDTAVLHDKIHSTSVVDVHYDNDDGAFTFENVVITDLDGNIVRDSNNVPITDWTRLPTTLEAANGYIITYDIVLDDDFYAGIDHYKYELDNTFTGEGLDSAGQKVTDSDSVNKVVCEGRYFEKSGVAQYEKTIEIDGATYYTIKWTINLGDSETVIADNFSLELTDRLTGTNQHYVVSSSAQYAPLLRIDNSASSQGLEWGVDAIHTVVNNVESVTFNLPAGGRKYQIIYYTYAPINTYATYSNTATFRDWTTAAVVSVAEKPTTSKTVNATPDYLSYTITAEIPKACYGTNVIVNDRNLSLQSGRAKFYNYPEDLVVSIYNYATGETRELTRTDASRDLGTTRTDSNDNLIYEPTTYKFVQSDNNTFLIRLPQPNTYYSGGAYWSEWPYQDDTRLTITYNIPRTTQSTTDPNVTINSGLSSNEIARNWAYVADLFNESLYREYNPLGKRGEVTDAKDGIVSYRVMFNDDYLPNGQTDLSRRLPIIDSSIHDAYFHDDYDYRTKYVNGSLYANVYEYVWGYDYQSDFGASKGKRLCSFKYTGDGDFSNGEITADWSDFTVFDFNADPRFVSYYPKSGTSQYKFDGNPDGTLYYHYSDQWEDNLPAASKTRNLEQLFQHHSSNLFHINQATGTLSGTFFIVEFVYDTRVEEEYRKDLTGSPSFELYNEADLGWVQNNTPITVGPASATVKYDTKILDKIATTIDDGNGNTTDRIKYEIVVNEFGYDLTDKEKFTITDQMCPDLMLYLDTVKIEVGEYNNTGQLVWSDYTDDPQLAYNIAENSLKVVVPDNCPVKITYDCKITKAGDVNLYNSVSITGYTKAVSANNAVLQVSGSGSSAGSGSEAHIYIRKTDSSTHRGLVGAVFALYGTNSARFAIDGVSAEDAGVPETIVANDSTELHFYKIYTTAANESDILYGTAMISDSDVLEDEGHYALVEVSAPSGYIKSNDVYEFYWLTTPEVFDSSVPVFISGQTKEIPNTLQAGIELPATGGIGTTLYTISGVFLITVACVYGYFLKLKRRKKGVKRGSP